MAVDDVTILLDRADVPYDLLQHDHTESGIAEAQALGVPVDEVAKTLILGTSSAPRHRVERVLVRVLRPVDVRSALR